MRPRAFAFIIVPMTRQLILASASPRRRQLIRALDIPARIVGSGDDEDAPRPGEPAQSYVQRLALAKARHAAAAPDTRSALILGADTAVAIDNAILGKPVDQAHAARMLKLLRGRPHRVVSGIALIDAAAGKRSTAARATTVHMRPYADAEIAAYIASGEPYDKAGAYAAQDTAFNPASRIDGCYLNVIGLPLCDVLRLLADFGAPARIKPDWRIPDGCPDCAQWTAPAHAAQSPPNRSAHAPKAAFADAPQPNIRRVAP